MSLASPAGVAGSVSSAGVSPAGFVSSTGFVSSGSVRAGRVAVRMAISACALVAALATVFTTSPTTQHAAHADGLAVTICVPTATVSCLSPIRTDGVQMWG